MSALWVGSVTPQDLAEMDADHRAMDAERDRAMRLVAHALSEADELLSRVLYADIPARDELRDAVNLIDRATEALRCARIL